MSILCLSRYDGSCHGLVVNSANVVLHDLRSLNIFTASALSPISL